MDRLPATLVGPVPTTTTASSLSTPVDGTWGALGVSGCLQRLRTDCTTAPAKNAKVNQPSQSLPAILEQSHRRSYDH